VRKSERHPRLDCDFCWTPLSDELATVLEECRVAFLLVVKPSFERTTTGKDITVIRGIGGELEELVEDENNANGNDGGQNHYRWTRRHS